MRPCIGTPASVAKPGKPGRVNYDPPSLVRAKAEPIPGLRALLEFAHPALAIIGFGLWAGFVLIHERPHCGVAVDPVRELDHEHEPPALGRAGFGTRQLEALDPCQ